ncbi:MAG: T9SS type A sorting domain-containing protein [Bacteroidetes bacterium]|nr:T9SS type A sorting domain-containing protein [Bacteroidota bacterium]
MQSIINIKIRFIVCFTMIMFFTIYKVSAQVNYDQLSDRFIAGKENDIYGINSKFIENVGQYGTIYEQYPEMGTILFAYEGFDIPILFTEKGIIHLHRKVKGPTPEEKEKEEKKRKKKSKETEIELRKVIDKAIVFKWINTNASVEVLPGGQCDGIHSYGSLKAPARAFRSISYKNIYPGIDLVFTTKGDGQAGYEFSYVIRPGSNLADIKFQFVGSAKRIRLLDDGSLSVRSGINEIKITKPASFYGDFLNDKFNLNEMVNSGFNVSGNEISFILPDNVDSKRTLVIDPFVTNTNNLSGLNNGIAKDVDYDYAGNVYVTGGGDGSIYKLAKFNAAGVLQWTFSGSLSLPSWTFGTYYGGWVVEKTTGNVYLGQGFAPSGGHRIIRINTTGIYDNYITAANASFLENWKMYWRCNSGVPQLLVAGGGTNSNNNFAICSPPATAITPLNVTGIPYTSGGWAQDIADLVIDPVTNSLYTIYGSLYGTPSLSNKIYKNNTPYSGASVAWNIPSGYVAIQEIANRPYLATSQIDNSANVLAINSSYLFYWDGKNLKAYDKNSGASIGTPLTIAANTLLMQGGIIADECNNIFVGFPNGLIKVYNFTGAVFDDASAPDITIPGFPSGAVYDLAYYEAQRMLYVSGKGFVASFDVSSYGCNFNMFTLNVTSSCATLTANVSVTPAPPGGSTVTYILMNGTTQVASNNTGIFSGLQPNINYTVNATVNMVCSGAATTTAFVLPGPVVATSLTNATCGNASGVITVNPTGGQSPYTFNINGGPSQGSNVFSGLNAGLYNVTVIDVNGCSTTSQVNITNSNGPAVALTKTDAACGNSSGSVTINATGGIPPLVYSINGVTFQTSNVFLGMLPGNYTISVKDANGCINVLPATILNSPGPTMTVVPTTTYCNSPNGVLTAIAAGGTATLQYSINANNYQLSNIFNGLPAGSYTVTVKDANGCLSNANATIANSPAPTISATTISASCNNMNGSITANSSGGTLPFQFSINGINFQSSNFFGGLTPGSYVVSVKDANNCVSTTTVTVVSTGGPSVTATAVASSCSANTGSITASGTGGAGALQYSINGTTFQAFNTFNGLAPGTYTLYVRDVNGCIGINIIVVPNTTPPAVTAIVTPTSCSLINGIITATGSLGTAPYQYSINGGTYQVSNVFTGLGTGAYTITIKDFNNCTSNTTVQMTNVSGLSLTASTIASSCSSNSGSIHAVSVGGVPSLTYSINGTVYQSSPDFLNLGGGVYTVYVMDANGCIATTSVTVATALSATINATFTNPTCAGANGTITVTATGGVAPLQYSINGTVYQSGTIFINVGPGTYTVYVKDAANCIKTTSVTLTNIGAGPGITSFTVVTKGAYPCNTALGKITNPKVNGATCNACTYSLNFGAFVPHATQLFLNLAPATYYVTAMDANGCTKTIQAVVGLAAVSTASTVVTGTNCNTSNGTISLTGIGPNTPYHSSISGIGGPWDTWDPTFTYTGLAPGIYEIILADDESFDIGPPLDPGGCLDTVTVIVPSIGGPSLFVSKSNGSCLQNDGTITATGTGGTPPLNYSINGGPYQSSGLFTNLSTGVYVIDVMDDIGCVNTKIDTIVNPSGPSVSASVLPATCLSPNGSVNAVAAGGTAPYQYSINGTVFQNTGTFTGLSAGTYTVTVGDASLCFKTTSVSIANTPRPTVTGYALAASCGVANGMLIVVGANGIAPYQFSIDGIVYQSSNTFNNLAAGFYTINIKDATGCINTTAVQVLNQTAPALTLNTTASTCLSANGTITATGVGVTPFQYALNSGAFQSNNIFTGLNGGPYTVTLRDANGCQISKNILVASPNVPQTLTGNIVNASCGNNNGSITAAATGGVTPYQYSINGSTFQVSTFFNLIAAGTYPLTVKDANGCLKSQNVTVANLAGPVVSALPVPSSCFANDGTITASVTGGTGLITYSKNGTIFQNSNVFNGLAPGSYTITAKDIKNCLSTTTVIVNQVVGPAIGAFDSSSVCGGNIVVTQNGGFSPYQYNMNGGLFQSSNVFACQPDGLYTLTIMDANGCKDTITILLATPLPVELLYFNAFKYNEQVKVEWVTATEINNDYYIVERSSDGTDFEMVEVVPGAGNSNFLINYFIFDKDPFSGKSYYRLKQVDFDGAIKISQVIKVDFGFELAGSLFPNPADNVVFLTSVEGIEDVFIYDVAGRLVSESHYSSLHEIKIDIAPLSSGFYTLKTKGAHDIYEIYSFVKK